MDLKEIFPLTITSEDEGLRLDKFLAQRFPEVSRSRWGKLLDANAMLVNENPTKASAKLRVGQVLTVKESQSSGLDKEKKLESLNSVELSELRYRGPAPKILYEDEDLLILDKPVGVAVHPGAGIGLEETIVAWLLEGGRIDFSSSSELLRWGDDIMEQQRPGIVHRLDKGTSGCLAVAKHPEAHRKMSEQFASKEAGRHYWACAQGDVRGLLLKTSRNLRKMLDENRRNIGFRIAKDGLHSFTSPIDRDPKNRLRMAVLAEGGKQAITHFRILESANEVPEDAENPEKKLSRTWLDVSLETGRTHQIRVHLAFLGHPIVGDRLYGGPENERIFLHAHTLYLKQPKTGEMLKVSSQLSLEQLQSTVR